MGCWTANRPMMDGEIPIGSNERLYNATTKLLLAFPNLETSFQSFCSRFQAWKCRVKVFARVSKLGKVVSKFLLVFPNLEKPFPSFCSCFSTWKRRCQVFARVFPLGSAVSKLSGL